jgi:ATP-dependent Clp protease adapter protein ClpS
VNAKRFIVCLDEITQNFVFGDRFGESYTSTVTLSNGSTRTIRLTPAVRDGGDCLELNDSGHISYMGLNGTTTNGRLMVQVRELPLLYPDEKACALAILAAPSVQLLYESLQTDLNVVKARLNELPEPVDNPEMDPVLMSESSWHRHLARLPVPVPLELRLLCGLVVHGHPQVKAALTAGAANPGDIPFCVAHGQTEARLQSLWPAPAEQTGKALMMDDPFTSMATVCHVLQDAFAMDPQSANEKTREIHTTGSGVLELSPGSSVTAICRRLNSHWRSGGLTLYCAPQRRTSHTAG